ncbi:hypothetical protein T10_13269 [Trichinella papuae]|uniref:Uncharacterized protein n=1 Tax=Trichinella papuae TaxID=268474 RepID=A0A0V1M324_9BILA|nr:hypothetical protein T10_13269 [Trichinella papuae]
MFHAHDTLLAKSMKFTTGNDSGADNCQRSPIANQRSFQDFSLHKCELC